MLISFQMSNGAEIIGLIPDCIQKALKSKTNSGFVARLVSEGQTFKGEKKGKKSQ